MCMTDMVSEISTVVDCNAVVERELSLMQYRLCAGVIRVSF